jgi:outer membrane protein TolC
MRLSPRSLLLVAGLAPALVGAAQPYDPDAAVPSLPYIAPARTANVEAAMGALDWRAAHDAVSAFPRGHIDILRWEAENAAPSSAPVVTSGALLMPAEAVRIALARRPDLFATSDMSALARAQADIAAVELARDVHRTWIDAVVAAQSLRFAQDVFDAFDAGTELAVRMTRGGNWGQDRLMREQLALTDAGIALAQARQRATATREQLIRVLGLWGEATQFTLPDSLPALPETPMSGLGLEATALRNHPRLSIAAIEAERARRGVAPRVLQTWSDMTAAALSRIEPVDGGSGNPLERLIASAPMLNLDRTPGGHDALRAAQTQAHAIELAATIRSHVREAYHQYRVTHDIARAMADVVHLQDALHDETVMRYNGMLKSTWDLLASARERIAAVDAALAAQRDFWFAHANLQAVLAGADYRGADAIGAGAVRKANPGGH